ncbi:hypothetical protein BBJ28_00003487 [Nothophytophthora sp. Chile5]|nr:hypothetical protein BBJ28_00003487 [Nothophytophthora sp. Chile5]
MKKAAPSSPFSPPRDLNNEPSTSETARKSRLIRRVPLLQRVVKHELCSEAELLHALVLATFGDGHYIYCQGQPERDLLFIEEGKVLITQRQRRRGMSTIRVAAPAAGVSAGGMYTRRATRRRSQLEAEMEIQLHTHEELEYFGEESLLQGLGCRVLNAVASGAVSCFVLSEATFARLLEPVHELMLYRHLLRTHNVLAGHRLFQSFSTRQKQHLLDHCTLERFVDGACIVEQGDKDDRYFILAEGEADVSLDEPVTRRQRSNVNVEGGGNLVDTGGRPRMAVVCRKTVYEGFGEMGLLNRPRTAQVVAAGPALCVVISRKTYIAASQLLGSGGVDLDAEGLLAMSLAEEWTLAANMRNLHPSNPVVSRYLVTFVKKFKAAYTQKFEGKTLYLDLLRRLHADPSLASEFAFVADRVAWDAPTSSLSILRAETRRVLSLPSAERSTFECSFVGRLMESTAFLDKFDRPAQIDKLTLARGLARVASFLTVRKDQCLCQQGKIESRAFLILRGSINIVNEDVNAIQAGNAVKRHEILATLSTGGSFGELSLVTRLQRSATALAAGEADLLVLDRPHLVALVAALPGVSVQHAMIERAKLLATLSFLRNSDFAQCIRVAHDLQEQIYEPRYLFLQEPVHLRTLYIVKSGEIAVFLRRNEPASTSSSGGNQSVTTKEMLVRVATIGPHEFFGVAIANANMSTTVAPAPPTGAAASPASPAVTAASPASSNSTVPPAPSPPASPSSSVRPSSSANAQLYVAATLAAATAGSPSPSAPPPTSYDLATTVFMCSTRVQMMELSERGWRRLSLPSLHSIRNSLLERHRWNVETVERQHEQGSLVYYHLDKPWQLVARATTPTPASTVGGACKDSQSRGLESSPVTQLARHVKEKKLQQQQQQGQSSVYARLFAPVPQSQQNSQPASPIASTGSESPRPEACKQHRFSAIASKQLGSCKSTSSQRPSDAAQTEYYRRQNKRKEHLTDYSKWK